MCSSAVLGPSPPFPLVFCGVGFFFSLHDASEHPPSMHSTRTGRGCPRPWRRAGEPLSRCQSSSIPNPNEYSFCCRRPAFPRHPIATDQTLLSPLFFVPVCPSVCSRQVPPCANVVVAHANHRGRLELPHECGAADADARNGVVAGEAGPEGRPRPKPNRDHACRCRKRGDCVWRVKRVSYHVLWKEHPKSGFCLLFA